MLDCYAENILYLSTAISFLRYSWEEKQKDLMQLLSGIEDVNSIVSLLSVDFQTLETDAKMELKARYVYHIKTCKRYNCIIFAQFSITGRKHHIVKVLLLQICSSMDLY